MSASFFSSFGGHASFYAPFMRMRFRFAFKSMYKISHFMCRFLHLIQKSFIFFSFLSFFVLSLFSYLFEFVSWPYSDFYNGVVFNEYYTC